MFLHTRQEALRRTVDSSGHQFPDLEPAAVRQLAPSQR